jgi:hypothetical protein
MNAHIENPVPPPPRPAIELTTVQLDRPVFILSLDIELGWGSFNHNGLERHRRSYEKTRGLIRQMLDLFDANQFAATWAVVGHLFLDHCSRVGDGNHNHVLQPEYSWWPQGWLSHDPFSNMEHDPYFYAPDIIDSLLGCPTEQELASHTFTHAILGDPECTREVAWSQLQEAMKVTEARGRRLRSLVYPRNQVGHIDVLAELGFTSYRGMDRTWYQRGPHRGRLNRGMHYMDRWLAFTPMVFSSISGSRIQNKENWTFNLPGSMFYVPCDGIWQTVPLKRRITQAYRGLDEAVKQNALFHLWFHPFNLGSSPRLLDGLESIIKYACRLRDHEGMQCLTMSATAETLQNTGNPPMIP